MAGRLGAGGYAPGKEVRRQRGLPPRLAFQPRNTASSKCRGRKPDGYQLRRWRTLWQFRSQHH
eukprot:8844525-Lingulodinium_polyedra.AAC.1